MILLLILLISLLFSMRFGDTIIGNFPYIVCATAIILYVLAFFNCMSWIDGILAILAAILAASILYQRKKLYELGRSAKGLLLDPYLICCAAVIILMCFFTRDEQVLEWDGYNFWAPDVKSLFYRDGFAPKYSNTAPAFGNYTPMVQIIWWIPMHIAQDYQEHFLFWSYYAFGAIMLFSVGKIFLNQVTGLKRIILCILVPCCAVLLPGIADTTWYRFLTVDPIIAFLFGMLLCLILQQPKTDYGIWKWKIAVGIAVLTLTKQIAVIWSIFVITFYCLWCFRKKKDILFAGLLGIITYFMYESWKIFCSCMDRSGYLTNQFEDVFAERLDELKNGVFLSSGENVGYIHSYIKAFFSVPIHRENTHAVDLTLAVLLLLLFGGVIIFGLIRFIPKKKVGRLLGFMAAVCLIIYGIVGVGQLTMFYEEQQYLKPLSALTLLCRYASPAHVGFVMLVTALASGQFGNKNQTHTFDKKKWIVGVLIIGIITSCGSYAEMKRRFIFDPFDSQRIAFRSEIEQTYCDFLNDIRAIPLDEQEAKVVLGIEETKKNPILINAASPIAFAYADLGQSPEADMQTLLTTINLNHCGYLYINDCSEKLCEQLNGYTENSFEKQTLYKIKTDTNQIKFEMVSLNS